MRPTGSTATTRPRSSIDSFSRRTASSSSLCLSAGYGGSIKCCGVMKRGPTRTGSPGAGCGGVGSIEGPIGPATVRHVEKAIAAASERGAEVLILRLDTPGGLVDSTREIVEKLAAGAAAVKPPPPPTAAAVKPVPAQKLAKTPARKDSAKTPRIAVAPNQVPPNSNAVAPQPGRAPLPQN